jgi:hypothetical protein
MANVKIKSLVDKIDETTKYMDKSFTKVILKDENITRKIGVYLIEYTSAVEEFFNRLHHRRFGSRVQQHDILSAMKKLGVEDEFIEAMKHLKMLRNRMVHQISFCKPLYNYFSKSLEGLDRCQKTKGNMRLILNVVQDEVCYL